MQIGNNYTGAVIENQYQNRACKSANPDQMNQRENQTDHIGNTDHADQTSADWNANAIFASGIITGQHFAIYRSEDYSPENPLYTIKGVDSSGKKYEETVDPKKVDAGNCNYIEFMALNAYLTDTGALEAADVNSFSRPTEDDLETADYMNALRRWRDTQFDVGNMVGYQHAAKNVDAIKNFNNEQNGTTKYIQFNGQTIKAYSMEGRLKSGILGMTTFSTGKTTMNIDARYSAESTIADPVIEVHLDAEDGGSRTVKVHINEIDPKNATELEMFALCSYADSQGMSGTDRTQNSYMELLQYVSSYGGYDGADNLSEYMEQKQDWITMIQDGEEEETRQMAGGKEQGSPIADMLQSILENFLQKAEETLEKGFQVKNTKKGIAAVRPLEDTLEPEVEEVRGQSLTDHINHKSKVPYSYLAKDGIVEYKGVIFVCDEVHSALCLGDMSNEKDVLSIPMSNGGTLKVNRDNLGDLGKAIGMFSPEDVRRILEAIAQDNKAQQTLQEIEEDKNQIGDGNTNTANGEPVRSREEAEQETKTETSSVLNDKSTFEITEEIKEEIKKSAEEEIKKEVKKEVKKEAKKIETEGAIDEIADEITQEMLDLLLEDRTDKERKDTRRSDRSMTA